jgi:hypothetical protein
VGLVETPAVFFQVLALYGASGAVQPRFFALAGAASLLPLAVKMQLAYIFPAAPFRPALEPAVAGSGPASPSGPLPSRSSSAAPPRLLVLAAAWLVPYRAEILWRLTNEWRLHALPMTLPRLFTNVFYNPFFTYFAGSPLLVLPSAVVFCGVLVTLLRGRGPLAFAHLLAFWWFAGGYAYLAISQYRPPATRLLVPPMAILAARRSAGSASPRVGGRPAEPARGLVCGGAVFLPASPWSATPTRVAAVQDALAFVGLYPLMETEMALLTGVAVLVGMALVFRLLGPRLPRWAARVPAAAPRLLAAVLVVAVFATEAWSYLDWTLHREYKLVSISRDLGRRLPEGSVIAGIFAPVLTLENRHRSLAIWDRYGNWEGDPSPATV